MYFRRIVSLFLILVFVMGFSVSFQGSASPAKAQEKAPVIKCDNQALCNSALKYLKKQGFDLKAAYKGEGELDLAGLFNLADGLKGKNAKAVSYLATNYAQNALADAGIDQAQWKTFFDAAAQAAANDDSAALDAVIADAGLDEATALRLDIRLLHAGALGVRPGGIQTDAKIKGIKAQLKKAGVSDAEIEEWILIYWTDEDAFNAWLLELGLSPEEFWAMLDEWLIEYYLLIGFAEDEIEGYFVEIPVDEYEDEYFLFDEYYDEYASEYVDNYADNYSGEYIEDYASEDYAGDYSAEEYIDDGGTDYVDDGGAEYSNDGGEEYTGGGSEDYAGGDAGGEDYAGGGGNEGGEY